MSKNYRAELVGLLGDSVDKNFIKQVMEKAFASQGLNYRYITMRVKKENLKDAVAGMRAIGMKGFQVTLPHKKEIIPFLDKLSPVAEIIGAVNAVRVQDEKLIGDNTVGKGFVTALMEEGVEFKDRNITILGSGSTAEAVAAECAISGAGKITIVARNKDSGSKLANLISEKTQAKGIYFPWDKKVHIPEGTDILVNCTNIGVDVDKDNLNIEYGDITEKMAVGDMVFYPIETSFLKKAKRRGAITVNGLRMLFNQIALNYCLWTEMMAPKDVLKETILKELGLDTRKEKTEMDKQILERRKKNMDERDRQLIEKMMEYYAGDPKRVQHFLKVYTFAKLIGESEKLQPEMMHILRTAAIVHDIGIKISEEKYGSSNGKYQEKEGPAAAEPMLLALGYEEEVIDRVLFLIAHHHTYNEIEGQDYQILVEADFLVNLFEDGSSKKTVQKVKENIFRTKTGIMYLETLFCDNK